MHGDSEGSVGQTNTIQLATKNLACRPVARISYGEVRSNEETDQTMPEAEVSGVGGRLGFLRLHFEHFALNWVFLKLLIFKSIESFYNFLEWQCRMPLFQKKKTVERKL